MLQLLRNPGFLRRKRLVLYGVVAVLVYGLLIGFQAEGASLPTLSRYTLSVDNASSPLGTPTYDGSGEAVHPDIIYFPGGFHGYRYWMALTPYPRGNDDYENPSILVSNDGMDWMSPPGLVNPVVPPPADVRSGAHYADPDMVFVNGRLELYYVYFNGARTRSRLYKITSDDGLKWSPPELLLEAGFVDLVSPAIIHDGSRYDMYSINATGGKNRLERRTSTDGREWSAPVRLDLDLESFAPWHLDIIKTEVGYEALIAAYPKVSDNAHTSLFYACSTDGLSWGMAEEPVLGPSLGNWDSRQIYRATFLREPGDEKEGPLYRIWYSAAQMGRGSWRIGYTEGRLRLCDR